jgi:hypothetical protein
VDSVDLMKKSFFMDLERTVISSWMWNGIIEVTKVPKVTKVTKVPKEPKVN